MRRHAPGCNGTVIAFSCTVVYPLCGCGVLWTCGAGTNRRFFDFTFFAAFSLARNTTSVNGAT